MSAPVPDPLAHDVDALSMNWDHSYGAKVAEEILVLDDPGPVSRHASATTTNEKPAATKPGGSSQPRSVQPTYMDPFKHFRAKKGFSEKAAVYALKSMRDSTRNSYEAKWDGFTGWCEQRQIDPLEVNANVMS